MRFLMAASRVMLLSALMLSAGALFDVAQAASATPSAKPAGSGSAKAKADEPGLPSGAGEYNKGCELFSIAKIQASKGNANGEKSLLKEALTHFEAALTENPKLTEAQSNIGFVFLTRREYKRAIGAFQKALTMDSKHVNSLNGLATSYAFSGSIDSAIKTFDQLLTFMPGESEYHFNKGSVLQKANRIEDARKAYEEAIRIKPDNQFALFNLGTLLENQGKLTDAKTYYEKAKSVNISNTAGLEALQRIDNINAELAKQNSNQ